MANQSSNSNIIRLDGVNTYSLDNVPELLHDVNCPCCSGNSDNDFKDSSDITYATNGSFQTMANYLTSGYWTETSRSTREWNLGNSGNNPKYGRITYSLGSNYNDNNGIANGVEELYTESFKLFEETLGIDFIEINSYPYSANIDIADDFSGAFVVSNNTNGKMSWAGLNIQQNWESSVYQGGFYLQTVHHEIGHALGLGHQGNYNATASYSSDAKYVNDSWQATMMSYFSQTSNTSVNADRAFLMTPSAVDWIALDDIYSDYYGYGVSNAFNGDTTFGFNTTISSSTSEIWSTFSSKIRTNSYCIVDGSGNDTLDLSDMTSNDKVDLRPTDKDSTTLYTSDIAGLRGNLHIAADTYIENCITGYGNDTLIGNNKNNNLQSGQGNDTISGGAGDDTLDGGSGNDTLIGGAGDDTYVVDSTSDTVTEGFSAGTDLIQSSVTFTASNNVENLTLTGSSNIDATGNTLDNTLTGNSGNNTLDGGSGNDTLDGGSGNDTLIGGSGNDTYVVNSTSDTVTEGSSAGTDLIQSSVTYTASNNVENLTLTGSSYIDATGNSLDNTLTGNSGNNTLDGGSGNDTLNGGSGDDILNGGAGTDTVTYSRNIGNYSVWKGTNLIITDNTSNRDGEDQISNVEAVSFNGTSIDLSNLRTGIYINSNAYQLLGDDGAATLKWSSSGSGINDDSSSLWNVTAAKNNSSSFQVLLQGEGSRNGLNFVITTDENGIYKTSDTAWMTGAEAASAGYESVFNMDFNENGILGG